jgi:cell division septal protein FtsQ
VKVFKYIFILACMQIALWAFLVVLVAAVSAAPTYFILDDGEVEGNNEITFLQYRPKLVTKKSDYDLVSPSIGARSP